MGSRAPPKAMPFRSAPSLDIDDDDAAQRSPPLRSSPVQRALRDVEQRASGQALGMRRSGDGSVSSSSGGGSRDAVIRPTQAATLRGSPPPPGLRGARPPAPPLAAPRSALRPPLVVQRGLGMRREDQRGLGRRREEWSDVRLPALHPATFPPWRGLSRRGVAQVWRTRIAAYQILGPSRRAAAVTRATRAARARRARARRARARRARARRRASLVARARAAARAAAKAMATTEAEA